MLNMAFIVVAIGLMVAGIIKSQDDNDYTTNLILYVLGPIIYVMQAFVYVWYFYDIGGEPFTSARFIRFGVLMAILAIYYFGCFFFKPDD